MLNKSVPVQVKMSPEDKATIEEAAKAMGQTVSAFIRFASLSLAKKVKPENNPAA